jgi:hypothetical protein
VHLLHRAKDGIDRAGLDAQRAAYTRLFINYGNSRRFFHSIFGVQRQRFPAQQTSQGKDSGCTTRRALVDFSLPRCDGLCIGAATLEIALATLRLRKQTVNAIHQRLFVRARLPGNPSQD